MKRLLGLALFFITFASASYIQLTQEIKMENTVTANSTTVNVTLLNSGDEPAYGVQLSLLMGEGFKPENFFIGTLGVGEPYDASIKVDIDDNVKEGGHPLIVKVSYADANGYPFSTVSGRFLVYKRAAPARIYGKLSNVALKNGDSEDMVLTVRNMDGKGHEIGIALFLPDELKTAQLEKSVFVDGQSEKTAVFDIESFGALPGSTYVVTAAMSYEDEGLMHASLASGIVRITGEGEVTGGNASEGKSYGESNVVLPALIFSLIALVIVYLYTKR